MAVQPESDERYDGHDPIRDWKLDDSADSTRISYSSSVLWSAILGCDNQKTITNNSIFELCMNVNNGRGNGPHCSQKGSRQGTSHQCTHIHR